MICWRNAACTLTPVAPQEKWCKCPWHLRKSGVRFATGERGESCKGDAGCLWRTPVPPNEGSNRQTLTLSRVAAMIGLAFRLFTVNFVYFAAHIKWCLFIFIFPAEVIWFHPRSSQELQALDHPPWNPATAALLCGGRAFMSYGRHQNPGSSRLHYSTPSAHSINPGFPGVFFCCESSLPPQSIRAWCSRALKP